MNSHCILKNLEYNMPFLIIGLLTTYFFKYTNSPSLPRDCTPDYYIFKDGKRFAWLQQDMATCQTAALF